MAIQVGDQAPEIDLFDSDKQSFKLSDHAGKDVVLLFFPGAFTSVCATELNTVNNDLAEYGDNTVVVGISTDSPFALGAFKEANQFAFPLVSDHDASVSAAYGVKHDHDFTPMKYDRVSKRSVFVVGADGKVKHVEVSPNPGVIPDLDAVKAAVNG